ncbi:MAG TPA: transcriptional regulator [Armatimonadota bacterium]|nr:transcriptional regulator [Armatimonadota bacterium]
MSELDINVHQPVRLRMLMVLSGVASADFEFMLNTLGLTKGNLSSHMAKLEDAGYVSVRKTFRGKLPHTSYSMTAKGTKALAKYWEELDEIRALGEARD